MLGILKIFREPSYSFIKGIWEEFLTAQAIWIYIQKGFENAAKNGQRISNHVGTIAKSRKLIQSQNIKNPIRFRTFPV